MDVTNKGAEGRNILCKYYFDEFLATLNRHVYEASLCNKKDIKILIMRNNSCEDYFNMMIPKQRFKNLSVVVDAPYHLYAIAKLK